MSFLTGTLPFGGESMIGITKNIITQDPQPPGEILPIAPVLDQIVMRCLAKEPEKRYPSVHLLQRDLAGFPPDHVYGVVENEHVNR